MRKVAADGDRMVGSRAWLKLGIKVGILAQVEGLGREWLYIGLLLCFLNVMKHNGKFTICFQCPVQ